MKDSYPVTIVIPVYADWASLKDCLASLKSHIDTKRHSVLLVNDCGPEADILENKIKKTIEKWNNFYYFRNNKNLGFVSTCNRAALQLDKTNNDILLLNSDTIVTEGFLEEMLHVLYEDPKNGAVSPRSNNATIATIPLSSAHQKGIEHEQSYKIFKKIKHKMPRYTIVPVAHGFCMLIRRTLIKKYGLFDKAFGKGYGEEVDFCMRISGGGYRSLLANRAYVFHMEAKSFSLEKKAKILEQNNKIIWTRYPEYRQSVRDYMDAALKREHEIELKSGIKTSGSLKEGLRGLTKRNKKVHSIVNKVHKRLNL